VRNWRESNAFRGCKRGTNHRNNSFKAKLLCLVTHLELLAEAAVGDEGAHVPADERLVHRVGQQRGTVRAQAHARDRVWGHTQKSHRRATAQAQAVNVFKTLRDTPCSPVPLRPTGVALEGEDDGLGAAVPGFNDVVDPSCENELVVRAEANCRHREPALHRLH